MNDLEKLLRDDLHDVAGSVDIPVSLDAIAAEHRGLARRSTLVRLLAVVVGVLLLVGVLWLAQGVFVRPPDKAVPNPLQTPAEPAPSPAIEPTPVPSATPPQATASGEPGGDRTIGMWVHYVSQDSLTVVREWHEVSAATPARGALEAMFAGGTDPDYRSTWPAGTHVLGIAKDRDTITVDLSAEAAQLDTGPAVETMTMYALVYTVTEAFSPTDGVVLTVEGRPFMSGHQTYTGGVMGREPEPGYSPIQVVVDSPAQDATVASPVRVTGLAAAFEATILWKVERPDGTHVVVGHAQTEEGMTLSPFSFELPPLEAGRYVITVTVDDPSGGEGPPPAFDDKEFTVR